MEYSKLVDNTVGYIECEHKDAFLAGAQTMHTILTRQHLKDIAQMDQMIKNHKFAAEESREDLRTIADILDRARSQ